MTRLLDTLTLPQDIKGLEIEQLNQLASEIRSELVEVISNNGGHLASNLGIVELSIALFYVFDLSSDRVLYDVSHQSYVHKILSGRIKEFKSIRQSGGLSGFTSPNESEYDSFIAGHSSTSISLGCGFVRSDILDNSDKVTISVVGDGSLTGGMCYEALNEVRDIGGRHIIVINDNNMSISDNVGATSTYLKRLRVSKAYLKIKKCIYRFLSGFKLNEGKIQYKFQKFKNTIKYFFYGKLPFEQYRIPYYGPIDGHNIKEIISYLKFIKEYNKPYIMHLITTKGKGYEPAEKDPDLFHGIGGNGTCKSGENFSCVLGNTMLNLASLDDKLVMVTAAMCSGTGLKQFSQLYPDRFYDVGIAEPHAVTMCAAMAKAGYKPYFAVYSTFLQRSYDQIIHDVAILNLPVRFLVDRAGIVGEDGVTHQGIFDISYLNMIPNMTIMSPMDTEEFKDMLHYSLSFNAPLAIRYPKGDYVKSAYNHSHKIEYGKWDYLINNNSDIVVLATGVEMVNIALECAQDMGNINVINCRFIKPLDNELLMSIKDKKIITIEENIITGGFGSSVMAFYNAQGIRPYLTIKALPEQFIRHASRRELLDEFQLSKQGLIDTIKNIMS